MNNKLLYFIFTQIDKGYEKNNLLDAFVEFYK